MPFTVAPEPISLPNGVRTSRILVVEDEELIRDTIALALADEGYAVVAVENGQAALDALYQNPDTHDYRSTVPNRPEASGFDLIVLDLMLPLVNGLDICRHLRREGNNVPILMLSAKGSETDRVVGLELGADDYLTKPFGMRELIARCRALLRRHHQFQLEPDQPQLKFQDIILFPQECRVLVRGEEVNFSPKEFKILELFMSYPRRVWTRDQLLERIWGPDFIGDSKTVDVHIRWLREKLEIDPSNPEYLVTVRGFGYRFG